MCKQRFEKYGTVKVDKSVTLKTLFTKFNGVCQGCGTRTKMGLHPQKPYSATTEHIIPLSEGGEHTVENTTLLCHECNGKANRARQLSVQKVKKSFTFFGFRVVVERLGGRR